MLALNYEDPELLYYDKTKYDSYTLNQLLKEMSRLNETIELHRIWMMLIRKEIDERRSRTSTQEPNCGFKEEERIIVNAHRQD